MSSKIDPNAASRHSTGILPVISLLITASLWGLSWYPLRAAEEAGIQGVWITLLAYGAASIVGLLLFYRYLPEFKRAPGLLLLIGLANAWCNIAFVLAVLDGNIVRVVLLFYLSPVWSTLLGWLILGEHLSKKAVLTLVLAMLGAIVMLWDPALGVPWPASGSDWLAITSGMSFSVANIAVRKLQDVSVHTKAMSIWFGVTVMAMVWVLIAGLPAPDVEVSIYGWTMGIGLVMIIAMTFSVQYGVTHMPVYRSAVILLFELVAAAISSQLLTDEVISLKEWVGGALIMLAAYVSARSFMEHVEEEETRQ